MLGAWRDDSTLVVTLLDTSDSRTVLGDSQVSLRQDGEDLDGDGVSSPNPNHSPNPDPDPNPKRANAMRS